MVKSQRQGEAKPPARGETQQTFLVNAREGARLLGISEIHFRRLAAAGTVPSLKVGRSRRFSVKALEAWIAEQSR